MGRGYAALLILAFSIGRHSTEESVRKINPERVKGYGWKEEITQ
jgi:hypothetical protein